MLLTNPAEDKHRVSRVSGLKALLPGPAGPSCSFLQKTNEGSKPKVASATLCASQNVKIYLELPPLRHQFGQQLADGKEQHHHLHVPSDE